jgi:inositol transport system permease protein
MNLLGINSYMQQFIKGVIIALAVIWDIYSKERKTYKKTVTAPREPSPAA